MYQFESFRMTDGMINKVIASRVVKVAKANKPLKTFLKAYLQGTTLSHATSLRQAYDMT